MSLIHWDKSVLSFHLKEIIEDGHGNNPVALAGLSAITQCLASRDRRQFSPGSCGDKIRQTFFEDSD